MPPIEDSPAAQALPATDAVAFVITVLPTWLYLTLTEAGGRHATFGKRAARMWVLTAQGSEPAPGRIALRNAVKLTPWQLAHLAVARFIVEEQLVAAAGCYVASLALVVLTVAMAVRDPWRRGLHDRVAGTRVVSVLDTPALRAATW